MTSLLNSVSPRHLGALVRHLEQEGFSCASALDRAGLSYEMLGWRWVPVSSVMTAMQEIVQQSGRSDLGFIRGQITGFDTNHLISQILLSASSLRHGLVAMAPLMPLASAVIRMNCKADRDTLVVQWTLSQPMPYHMALVALETLAVAIHRYMLFLLQEQRLHYEMEFSWAAPAHSARYWELKSPTVMFGKGGEPALCLRLPAELVDRPLLTADPATLRQARREAMETLQELAHQQSFGEWVEHILTAVENEILTQDRVAGLLSISGKTLSRYLGKEGVRFGEIAKKVRQVRAEQLLLTTLTDIEDIAHRLGYSTTSNFVRSFKANAGVTPGAFRRK